MAPNALMLWFLKFCTERHGSKEAECDGMIYFLMSKKIGEKTGGKRIAEKAHEVGKMIDVLAAYHPLLQTLLKNRGIATREAAEKFLNPDYTRDIYDPFLILNMERAVERILRAIENKEKIIVYGDYDCDGIPGSVVLHDFFKKIGYAHFGKLHSASAYGRVWAEQWCDRRVRERRHYTAYYRGLRHY